MLRPLYRSGKRVAACCGWKLTTASNQYHSLLHSILRYQYRLVGDVERTGRPKCLEEPGNHWRLADLEQESNKEHLPRQQQGAPTTTSVVRSRRFRHKIQLLTMGNAPPQPRHSRKASIFYIDNRSVCDDFFCCYASTHQEVQSKPFVCSTKEYHRIVRAAEYYLGGAIYTPDLMGIPMFASEQNKEDWSVPELEHLLNKLVISVDKRYIWDPCFDNGHFIHIVTIRRRTNA